METLIIAGGIAFLLKYYYGAKKNQIKNDNIITEDSISSLNNITCIKGYELKDGNCVMTSEYTNELRRQQSLGVSNEVLAKRISNEENINKELVERQKIVQNIIGTIRNVKNLI